MFAPPPQRPALLLAGPAAFACLAPAAFVAFVVSLYGHVWIC